MAEQADSTLDVTVVALGAGDPMWVVGERQWIKLGESITGGALLISESLVVPGAGPPPHVHRQEHEGFYILAGEMEFLGEQCVHVARAGTFFFAPWRQAHQFRNTGTSPVRYILMAIPGAIERFFRNVATPCSSGDVVPPPFNPAEAEHVMTEAAKWGIDVVELAEPADRRPVPAAVESVEGGVRRLCWCQADAAAGVPGVDELHLPPGASIGASGNAHLCAAIAVLEGTIDLQSGNTRDTAKAGSYVHVKAGVATRVSNSGPGTARVLRYLVQAEP